MCLYEEAHGVDASHPIFHEPFPVELTYHEMATPDHYRKYDAGLGPTMQAWRVCKEPVAGYHGVVADGFGFTDSPDAEWISSGRNSKNPRAAALARQGNFFQWGFSASPSALTDEARTVFLNTLAYMSRFDGVRPLAVGKGISREWLQAYVGLLEAGSAAYARSRMPAEWLDLAGRDFARLRSIVDAELGFVRYEGRRWVVDRDCKRLGLANRDPRLLERCVEMLEQGKDADLAGALLLRYTDRTFESAAEWKRWLVSVRDRLYFSDAIGQWRVAPEGYPQPYRRAEGSGAGR